MNIHQASQPLLLFTQPGRAGFQVHLDSWSCSAAEQVPAPAPVSLSPAAQLLLLSSPGLSLAWRGTPEAPLPPSASLGAAPPLSSFSREALAFSPERSGSQVQAEGGQEGKPRHRPLSGDPVLPPQLTGPAGRGNQARSLPSLTRWAGRTPLIPLASWSQSRPPTELLLGKFNSRAGLC